jgi:epidermal growth factor receptor substrate 15
VKGVLMDSKLPLDTLGKIWDLADMDKDGMLDRHEFMVVRTMVELLQICGSLLSHSL